MEPHPHIGPVAKRPAKHVELEALPENVVGEIVDGELYVSPRPRGRHTRIVGLMQAQIANPFDRGVDGPGGWWIASEPGIRLAGEDEVVPDLAGWRRTSLATFPEGEINARPDWVCEVLSPGNWRTDLQVKRPFYGRIGIPHMWIVDPQSRTLWVLEQRDGLWVEVAVHVGDERVRAVPFDAIEIDVAEWWGR